jgi:hypothetical protein
VKRVLFDFGAVNFIDVTASDELLAPRGDRTYSWREQLL